MGGDWVATATFLSGAGTLAIFVVWSFYAKLALNQWREQRRPWFVLESGGPEFNSPCYLINMSPQTAHVSSIAVACKNGESVARRVRRTEQEAPQDTAPSLSADRLGPLSSGSTLLVGTFAEMFDDMVSQAAGSENGLPRYEDMEALEVRVIAESMVNGEGVLGATRRFLVQQNHGEQLVVRPEETKTRQLRSRKERRRVESWLQEVWDNEGFAESLPTEP